MAARRLEASKELLIIPRNVTGKMENLLKEKRSDSLLQFCDSETMIDEVDRVARYNGFPKAGIFNILYLAWKKLKLFKLIILPGQSCFVVAEKLLNQARQYGTVSHDRAFEGAVRSCKSTYVWDEYIVHAIYLLLGVAVEKLKLVDWKTMKSIAVWCQAKLRPTRTD
jgi:hypothetical protein